MSSDFLLRFSTSCLASSTSSWSSEVLIISSASAIPRSIRLSPTTNDEAIVQRTNLHFSLLAKCLIEIRKVLLLALMLVECQ